MMRFWAVTAQLTAFQQMQAMSPFSLVGLNLAAKQSRMVYGDLTQKPKGDKAAGEKEISTWGK